jgi:predicted O-methyltransferase YrrM
MMELFKEIFESASDTKSGLASHYPLIYSVALGLRTQHAFEFGSGFSTLVILEALSQTKGCLTICDPRHWFKHQTIHEDRKTTGYTKQDIQRYSNWTYLQKNSQTSSVVAYIRGRYFDFVLHDGAHRAEIVEKDLSTIVPRMRRNGVILVHDTMHQDFPGIFEVVQNISCAKEILTLPYDSGLTIIRILEDFGVGTIPHKIP